MVAPAAGAPLSAAMAVAAMPSATCVRCQFIAWILPFIVAVQAGRRRAVPAVLRFCLPAKVYVAAAAVCAGRTFGMRCRGCPCG